jgi:hypothetical protein
MTFIKSTRKSHMTVEVPWNIPTHQTYDGWCSMERTNSLNMTHEVPWNIPTHQTYDGWCSMEHSNTPNIWRLMFHGTYQFIKHDAWDSMEHSNTTIWYWSPWISDNKFKVLCQYVIWKDWKTNWLLTIINCHDQPKFIEHEKYNVDIIMTTPGFCRWNIKHIVKVTWLINTSYRVN